MWGPHLDGVHALAEEVHAELLEAGTGDGGVEINTLKQGINLEGCLGRCGQSTLRTLSCGAQTAESTSIGCDVLLVLALELLHA